MNGHAVKYRRRDLIGRMHRRTALNVKQADGHERTDGTQLALIFVTAVTCGIRPTPACSSPTVIMVRFNQPSSLVLKLKA